TTPADVGVAMSVSLELLEFPRATGRGSGPENVTSLMLGNHVSAADRRGRDFVRILETSVVAVEPADGEIRVAEPVLREPAAQGELERVVLANRLRRRDAAGSQTGRRHPHRN